MKLKPVRGALLRMLASAALLAVLVKLIGIKELGAAFAQVDLRWLVAAMFVVAVVRLILAARWFEIVKHHGIDSSYREIFGISLMAWALGPVIPGGVAPDFARGYQLAACRNESGVVRVAATVVIDRAAGAFSVLLTSLLASTAALILARSGSFLLPVILLFAAIAVGTVLAVTVRRWMPAVISKRPGLQRYWSAMLNLFDLITNTERLLRLLPSVIGLSLLAQLGRCVVFALIFRSLGAEVEFVYYLIFIPLLFIISYLPISVGGLGVREAALVAAFQPLGVPAEVAFSAGIISYLVNLAFAGLVLLVPLLAPKRLPRGPA
jgi:uncharacterized protein (TIRG00374 family)